MPTTLVDREPPIRVFLGSSSNASTFTKSLAKALKRASTYQVNYWEDSFAGETFIEILDRILRSHEFFVLVLSSDHRIHPPVKGNDVDDPGLLVARDNVIFEAGAAFGKWGLGRVILVCANRVHVPADISGVNRIVYDDQAPSDIEVGKTVKKIVERISRASQDPNNDGRLHWLSLFRCNAARHDNVVKFLELQEEDARESWDVRYERYGVLWGKADNFLLFSVPDVESFIKFGTEIRKRGAGQLRSMDSRLLFPKKHYRHPDRTVPAGWVSHLVFLPVEAHQVETVYGELHKRAQHQGGDMKRRVRISYVGVATGEDDVFFITDAESTREHQRYISKGFIDKEFLAANTSSFAISSDSYRRSGQRSSQTTRGKSRRTVREG